MRDIIEVRSRKFRPPKIKRDILRVGKVGRPRGDQPWVKAGISRQAWHKRQKGKQ